MCISPCLQLHTESVITSPTLLFRNSTQINHFILFFLLVTTGGKTYFIVGRKEDLSSKSQTSDTENSTENQEESREEDSGQSDKGDAEGSRSSPQNGNQSSKPLLGEPGSDSKQNSPVWRRNSPGTKKATTPEALLHVS